MNYPVWDVSFGAGLLIAIVAITHVFVSHFAVGGGLFLVLTEKKAYKTNDVALLDWLKVHTKFFVLVTVVFGALSGVGIWFTIGLIHPSATSALIHNYVWGWAIEWVFFFVEITAALLYLYGWNKLDRKTHLWYGWVYFIAAFASMVIINGILTFMLTPGKWLENHEFWTGFFNPTYFPSLLLRFAFALALAGVYALITASVQNNADLKGTVVKWSATWIIPAFVVLPLFAYWYIGNIPAAVWQSARGIMPTATRYASLILVFSAATFLLALLTLIKPKRVHLVFSLLIAVAAFLTIGSFEFIREAIRKPFIIYGYMYGNSVYKAPMPGDSGFTKENLDQAGVLTVAKWVEHRTVDNENRLAVGKEIFRVECQSCHTADAYRGVRAYLDERNWDEETTFEMLKGLDLMMAGVMPPFAGTDAERRTLASYLSSLRTTAVVAEDSTDGHRLFERYCATCHQYQAKDAAFTFFKDADEGAAMEVMSNLTAMDPRMPYLKLNHTEEMAVVNWAKQRF